MEERREKASWLTTWLIMGVGSASLVSSELDLCLGEIEGSRLVLGTSGEATVVKEAIREEMFAPNGPKECTIGSFSSSASCSSCGSLSSLDWLSKGAWKEEAGSVDMIDSSTATSAAFSGEGASSYTLTTLGSAASEKRSDKLLDDTDGPAGVGDTGDARRCPRRSGLDWIT